MRLPNIFLMLVSLLRKFLTNFTFLLNILKIKQLILTNGTLVIKQSENSLNFTRNMEYGYITSAILHLRHRGKITLSKLTKL